MRAPDMYDPPLAACPPPLKTYAADSRIPTMEFGTPEQDALRRDLTINSLFYNINLHSVEDFTGG